MNKSGLIDAVSKTTSLAKRDAEDAVNAVFHIVSSEVRVGRRVVVTGFGSFNPTRRGARMARNPQTGAPVKVAASRGMRFAASATLKDVLNGRAVAPATKMSSPARSATRATAGASTASAAVRASGRSVRTGTGGVTRVSARQAVPVAAGRTTTKVVGRAPASKAATRASARKAARQSARKAAGRPPAKRASQRSAKKAVRRA